MSQVSSTGVKLHHVHQTLCPFTCRLCSLMDVSSDVIHSKVLPEVQHCMRQEEKVLFSLCMQIRLILDGK